ncbi:hypothetical protein HYPSUDRAFT_188119 [Hypholoma sublateritium FD-334 SS-4]|uniref:FAD-binding PCMH-type domain-containing protein n=1 Tax=Hypholoma sublateritium (strain FD-334 SS-4) TaxID=945553 RepID=A0A0D2NQF4_HYPSF|nr:hypothetical protein HYPSUDRAFT_188119 [Hypholoma sublateritium FD-334 SS-4]
MLDSLPSPWALVKVVSELLLVPLLSVPNDWVSFNASMNGRLRQGVPFAQPCFASDLNTHSSLKCPEIQERYEDHLFRSESFGAYQLTNWEECQTTGDKCLLDWKSPLNPVAFQPPQKCSQGGVPSYYIEVKGPNDVRAAYAFSRKTNIPLVIKNSGHDFIGRSSGPGALALWTQGLKRIKLERQFVPVGCLSAPTTAITIGAGQHFSAIYDFARENNVTFVGGADPSVGASGGWVMGGGHSALSPALGLGVDRVLQFKIVTADGKYRTVNKCQDSDLFFALRGGGGGTFGVVLESTFLASPRVTLEVVIGKYNNTRENSVELIKQLSKGAVQLASDGWGGYVTPSLSSGVWINPVFNSTTEAEKSAASVVNAFRSVRGTTMFLTMDSFSDFFDTFIAPSPDPVGRPFIMATRLIPSGAFDDERLIDLMANAMVDSDFGQILAVAPYGFKDYDEHGTSINPAWRDAVWSSFMSYSWNFDATLAEKIGQYQKLKRLWTPVRARTPGAAVYMNEADIYEPDYENAFWGPHYERLLSIKHKYDPHHLLDCWRCVGWKGAQDKRYRCYPNVKESTDQA